MKKIILFLTAAALTAQTPATAPEPAKPAWQRIGTMSELMIDIIYPTSDAIFYVERNEPKTEVEWNRLRDQALMLAESGNLLLMPGRSREAADWVKFTGMMIEAGNLAFKAAKAKDLQAVVAVNDLLYNSCVQCHAAYRPNYPRRPPAPEKK